MEIEQQIKEFTPEGECVVVYTLTSASGSRVSITNADAAVVSFSYDDREWIAGFQEFVRRPINPRTKLWEARIDQNRIIFNSEDNGIPRQIEYSLDDDGLLEINLLRPKSLPWIEEPFRSFQILLSPECRYNICNREALSMNQARELFGNKEIDVDETWSEGIKELVVAYDNNYRLALTSTLPRLDMKFRESHTSITPMEALCDIYNYDPQAIAAGGEAIIQKVTLRIGHFTQSK